MPEFRFIRLIAGLFITKSDYNRASITTLGILMKATQILMLLGALIFSNITMANDLLSSAKSLLGNNKGSTSGLSVTDMIGSVSDSLGITKSQATGSLGSIFEYAKNNISKEQLSTISDSLPNLDTLLGAVPAITGSTGDSGSKSGLGDLLNKASKYSSALGGMAALQKQFESLGLDPEMIGKVIQSAYSYLNTEQGQQVKALLEKGLSSLKL